MKYVGYIILIVLILLGITFAVLNSDTVALHYYAGRIEMPLSLCMAMSVAIGILLGILVMLPRLFRLRVRARKLRKRLKVAEQEIENLRAIPIKDTH
jgi:lipopolysaccharide assembly protein A